MAYVDRLEIANTTSTGLMVADSAVRADANARVVNLTNHAVARTCIISGGTLQALNQTSSGCLIDGAKIYGGQLIVRYAGNSGTNWELYGGNAYLQSNAAVSKVDIYDGGILNTYVGTATDVTVYSGGKTILQAQSKVIWKNLDVKAGGSVTLGANFEIQNNINIENGAVICLSTGANPLANVSAVNGTIYNFTYNANIAGSFGHGITLSNFTQTTGTLNLINDGVADGGTVTAGTLQALNNNGANGAWIKNVTFNGGTMIVRGPTNKADTLAQNGAGTLHIQQGASATNVTQTAGTVNVSGLAASRSYVSKVTVAGGNCTLAVYADAHDITVTGGNLFVYNSVTARNVTENGGDIGVSGTSAVLIGGSSVKGSIYTIAGGVISNFDLAGTVRGYANTGGVWSGGTVSASELDAYDAAGGGVIRNTRLIGGIIIVRSNGNIGSGINVSGGTLYFQSGASGANITLNNGSVSITQAGTIIDGMIYKGGTFHVSSGTTVKNLQKVGAATVNLYGNGVVDGGAVSAGILQALVGNGADGAVIKNYAVSNGATMILRGETNRGENIIVSSGGTLHVQSGAVIRGGEVLNGGKILDNNWAVGGVASNLTLRTGAVGSFTIATARLVDLTMEAGATLTVTSGNISGGNIAGGTLNLSVVNISGATLTGAALNAAGTVHVLDTTLTDLTQTGAGAVNLSSGAAATGGTIAVNIYASSGATIRDLDVVGGDFKVYSGAVASDVDLAGGRAWVSSGGLWSGGVISTKDINIYDTAGGGLIRGVTMVGGQVIVRSGGNIASAINVSGGELCVQNGASAVDIDVFDGGAIDMYNRVNGVVSQVRIHSGGMLSGTNANHSYTDVTVEAGGQWTLGASFDMKGDINFAAGALTNDADASAQNGVISNFDQTLAGTFGSGITLSNYTVTATAALKDGAAVKDATVDYVLYVSNGAEARNVTLVGAAGHRFNIYTGGRAYDTIVSGGTMMIHDEAGNGYASGAILRGGDMIVRHVNNICETIAISGNILHVQSGASAHDVTMETGTINLEGVTGKISELVGATISDGTLNVSWQGSAQNVNMTGGSVNVNNGGTVSAVAGNTLYNVNTVAGAKVCFVKDGGQATLVGANTTIAEGTLWYEGTTQMTGHGANGVISGLGAGDAAYKLSIGSGIVLSNATGNNYEVRISAFSGAKIDGVLLGAGAIIGVNGASAEFDNVTLSGGHGSTCNLNLSAGGQTASNTVIGGSGAKIQIFGSDAKIENTTLKAGGSMNLAAAGIDTGELVTLDFSGTTGNQTVDITNLSRLAAGTTLAVRGIESGATYTFTKGSSATDKTLDLGQYRAFDMTVAAGSKYSNGFLGVSYDFTTGKSLTTTSFTVGSQGTAAELDSTNATVLADGGLATKWTSTTDVTTLPAAVAGADTTGDAWLTVDGANLASALYGAEGNFAHDVNLWLYEGTVKNLAAGATAGGSVENVNLLVSDNGENGMSFTGVAYAGGFGNVTGEVKAELYGGTFAKDFYAGALANKLSSATSVGDITTTVSGGTFSGNIYGASAVKTDTTKGNGTRHTAGDVTLTVTGGETAKGTQACIFAGGYATGNATGTVYTVDSVTATISGGSWGTAAGGRGVFGGVMASGVEAEVLGNVNLTVSGGSMGNVYGGGWAQQGGTSAVGNVNISIAGGAVANVFGGGSTSSSGGSTVAGNVTITVSGGTISNAIYARGQFATDATGTASVVFTGNKSFTFENGVYGYSYVGGAASDATLSFNGYTGEFSGKIGGFNGIKFTDGTAMTLGTEYGNVSNTAWIFDAAERDVTLAGTAFLNWNDADFTGDTITLNLNNGDAIAWDLVSADTGTVYNKFDVQIDGTSILSDTIDIDDVIAGTGTAYDGWGFTDDNGVLKFKNLA